MEEIKVHLATHIVPLFIAAFGGFMLNMMNLYEDSKKLRSERALKDGLYWLFFCAWPVIGAILAFILILDGSVLRPLLAFTVGLGAPTTIKSWMSAAFLAAGPPKDSEPQ